MDFYSKLQTSDEQILLPIFVYTYRCVYDCNKIIRLREISFLVESVSRFTNKIDGNICNTVFSRYDYFHREN